MHRGLFFGDILHSVRTFVGCISVASVLLLLFLALCGSSRLRQLCSPSVICLGSHLLFRKSLTWVVPPDFLGIFISLVLAVCGSSCSFWVVTFVCFATHLVFGFIVRFYGLEPVNRGVQFLLAPRAMSPFFVVVEVNFETFCSGSLMTLTTSVRLLSKPWVPLITLVHKMALLVQASTKGKNLNVPRLKGACTERFPKSSSGMTRMMQFSLLSSVIF